MDQRWTSAVPGPPPRYLGDVQAADFNPIFKGKSALQKHNVQPKYVSSMITQLRTGRIGLRAFLFHRGVPDAMTPLCSCGLGPETTYHILLRCPHTRPQQQQLLPLRLRTSRDVRTALEDKADAGKVAQWFLELRKLPQFLLALKLHGE